MATVVVGVLVGVALGAVGVLAILTLAGAFRGRPSPDDGEMSVDAVLRMHLPSAFSSACAPHAFESARTVSYAAVQCDTGQGWQVQYASLHDAQAMRDTFASDKQQVTQTAGGGWDVAAACRRTQARGVGPYWVRANRALRTHHRLRKAESMPTTRGRVMCWRSSRGEVTLEWYDSDTHILAKATAGSDYATRLFRWWRDEAGPEHPPMSMSSSSRTTSPGSPSESLGGDMSSMPSG